MTKILSLSVLAIVITFITNSALAARDCSPKSDSPFEKIVCFAYIGDPEQVDRNKIMPLEKCSMSGDDGYTINFRLANHQGYNFSVSLTPSHTYKDAALLGMLISKSQQQLSHTQAYITAVVPFARVQLGGNIILRCENPNQR